VRKYVVFVSKIAVERGSDLSECTDCRQERETPDKRHKKLNQSELPVAALQQQVFPEKGSNLLPEADF
jgi:hypothetical protein